MEFSFSWIGVGSFHISPVYMLIFGECHMQKMELPMSSPFVFDLHPPKGRLQRGLGLCVLDGGLTEAGESSKELVRQWVEGS